MIWPVGNLDISYICPCHVTAVECWCPNCCLCVQVSPIYRRPWCLLHRSWSTVMTLPLSVLSWLLQIYNLPSPICNPDVWHIGPGHVVAGHSISAVVRTQPVLLHLQKGSTLWCISRSRPFWIHGAPPMLLMEVMGYKSTKTVYNGQVAIVTGPLCQNSGQYLNNLAGPQPQDI